ncbi:MAG: MoaD/ThiS family protein [Pedosphaera parvula]|nr:MoaD/ThiS family protein [Pedosphaera parvula]
MQITVHFYSYFKELAGCANVTEDVPAGATLDLLLQQIHARFPKLAAMRNSTLVAVGLDYQNRQYKLKEGDEVSLFPPVQGG